MELGLEKGDRIFIIALDRSYFIILNELEVGYPAYTMMEPTFGWLRMRLGIISTLCRSLQGDGEGV